MENIQNWMTKTTKKPLLESCVTLFGFAVQPVWEESRFSGGAWLMSKHFILLQSSPKLWAKSLISVWILGNALTTITNALINNDSGRSVRLSRLQPVRVNLLCAESLITQTRRTA